MKVDFTDPVKLGNAPYHRGTRPCKPAEHLERLDALLVNSYPNERSASWEICSEFVVR